MKVIEETYEDGTDEFFKNFTFCNKDGTHKTMTINNNRKITPKASCESKSQCNIPSKKINVEGEFDNYRTDKRPIETQVSDYCHGGPGEARERALDATQAFTVGMANIVGIGGIIGKGMARARGGSPNYVDQPTELIKKLTDRLRQTRDRAFYISQCGEYKASYGLWLTIKKLQDVINAEIKLVHQELGFEVQALGLADSCIAMCILSIVLYLLIIVVDKK